MINAVTIRTTNVNVLLKRLPTAKKCMTFKLTLSVTVKAIGNTWFKIKKKNSFFPYSEILRYV